MDKNRKDKKRKERVKERAGRESLTLKFYDRRTEQKKMTLGQKVVKAAFCLGRNKRRTLLQRNK